MDYFSVAVRDLQRAVAGLIERIPPADTHWSHPTQWDDVPVLRAECGALVHQTDLTMDAPTCPACRRAFEAYEACCERALSGLTEQGGRMSEPVSEYTVVDRPAIKRGHWTPLTALILETAHTGKAIRIAMEGRSQNFWTGRVSSAVRRRGNRVHSRRDGDHLILWAEPRNP